MKQISRTGSLASGPGAGDTWSSGTELSRTQGVSQRGFTLIELLLATSIGSMVLAAVYTTFSTAIDSQKRIERVSVQTQESRFLYERLRNDFKNLVFSEDNFSGGIESLGFTSVSADLKAHQVKYRLRDDKQNNTQLIRTSRVQEPAEGAGQVPSALEVVVYERLDLLSFGYLIEGTWTGESDGSTLPTAIKCNLQVDGREISFTFNLELDNAPA